MKRWYQSKFVWFAILIIATAVANFFGFVDWQPDAHTNEIIQLITGIIIWILRAYTTKAIR